MIAMSMLLTHTRDASQSSDYRKGNTSELGGHKIPLQVAAHTPSEL